MRRKRLRVDIHPTSLWWPLAAAAIVLGKRRSEIASAALISYLERIFSEQLNPKTADWLDQERVQYWKEKLADMLPETEEVEE